MLPDSVLLFGAGRSCTLVSMRRRFFVERFENHTARLTGEQAHHLGRVLRAQPGQLYELSDGSTLWLGRVERVTRNEVQFSLLEKLPTALPRLHLILLLGIVKFDRLEWCLEKAAELGVNEIVPLAAARSEKALLAAAEKRAARWRKILLESAQQARRIRPPVLHPVARTAAAFASRMGGVKETVALLLSERTEASPLREVLAGRRADCAVLAVGPEGGWTDAEFAAAREAGFAEASLGRHILRTETAVIAALAILNYALGD